MRTLILALAVILLAAPAWADVKIIVEDADNDRVVTISYDSTGETELVRAFALNITATDGNIIDINDYDVGDDNGGFGVFPGKFASVPIDVNPTTGLVDDWYKAGYDPVAPAGDPDAEGDIPGPAITVEMGSLYDTLAPGKTGLLCTITVDENVTSLCVTGNAIRGNVVLETAAEATLDLTDACWEDGECFPSTAPYAVQYAAWVYAGKPSCWCEPPDGTGYQCDGDAAGDLQYARWWVFSNDLTVLATEWKKLKEDPTLDWCADIDHAIQYARWPAFSGDLTVMATNWKSTTLPGDCPRPD